MPDGWWHVCTWLLGLIEPKKRIFHYLIWSKILWHRNPLMWSTSTMLPSSININWNPYKMSFSSRWTGMSNFFHLPWSMQCGRHFTINVVINFLIMYLAWSAVWDTGTKLFFGDPNLPPNFYGILKVQTVPLTWKWSNNCEMHVPILFFFSSSFRISRIINFYAYYFFRSTKCIPWIFILKLTRLFPCTYLLIFFRP